MGAAIPGAGYKPSAASGAQVIDGSLRFGGDSHLTRTPSSAGNETTYTFSFWVKPCDISSNTNYFFTAGSGGVGGVNNMALNFDLYNRLVFGGYKASDYDVENTEAYYRDTGWYHFVTAVDTTQGAAANRVKFYVNGIEQSKPTSGSPFAQNSTPFFNSNVLHTIGSNAASDFNGYMSQVYMIDGLALEPTDFGYTDPLTNTWRPKKYEGVFNGPQDGLGGVTWSSYVSGSVDGTYPLSNCFTAPIGSSYTSGTRAVNPGALTLNIAALNLTVTNVRLNTFYSAANTPPNPTLTVNGVDVTTNLSDGDQTHVVAVNGQLNTVVWSYNSTSGPYVYMRGIEVDLGDGEGYRLLADGSGGPAGVNGFYLPFDGNSPIGQDQSGNANDWAAINFGSSNVIPKATGALPILNTQSGGRIATVGVRTDAHAANLVLALPLVGDALDLSNQINSGSTTKTVTTTGALPGSNPDAPFYDGSYYFDGSDDHLNITGDSDIALGTGDFTLEFFVYFSGADSTLDTIMETRTSSSASDGFLIGRFHTGGHENKIELYTASGYQVTADVTVANNVWTHVAAVRSSSVTKLYINGEAQSTPYSDSNNYSNDDLTIGENISNAYQLEGYIQDFRIYKGAAKYTSNFIPASANPTILSDTSSGVALGSELTKLSDITTEGSVSFPNITATDEYLVTADNADWTFGSGDFTMECFAYIPTPIENRYESLAMKYSSSDKSWFWSIYSYAPSTTGAFASGTSAMNFYFYYSGGSQVYSNTSYTIRQNAWNHLAVARDGNTVRLYVNGVQGNTIDVTGLTMTDSAVPLRVGVDGDGSYNARALISNLRIVKGTCLYPSGTSFVPPTEPLTNVTNTKLLCCQSPSQPGAASVAPLVSGINNGTQWSALTTADAVWTRGPLLAFNGGYVDNDGNTTAHPAGTNKNIICDFTGQGLSGNVKIFGYTVSSGVAYQQVKFDDGSWIDLTGSSTGYYWFDAGDQGSFDIMYTKGINGGGVYLGGVEVAGTVLRDPLDAHGVSASYFNPFMPDDIKTVMGQETGYATLNDLMTSGPLTDGNLIHPGSAEGNSSSSIKVGSGKWYAEVTLDAAGHLGFGWTYYNQAGHPWVLDIAGYYLIYNSGTTLQLLAGAGSTLTSGTGTLARLIPYQMCIDVDNNKAYIGDGVTWFNDDWNQTGSPGNPLTGENPTFTLPAGKEWYFWIYPNLNGASKIWANFGQKPLKYAPPEGYKLLNYATLPSPGVVRSDKVVTATKWTSTGGSSNYDVDCRLAPDLIWHKCYDGTQNNSVFTSTLGPDVRLDTSGNSGAQDWHPAYFLGFNHVGYGVSITSSDLNPAAGAKMISYCWKAGGSKGTFNKDGIVYASAADAGLDGGSATPSASSVGTKQGFSIIKVAGSNTASKTFSHGLSQAPTFAIGKLLATAPSNGYDQDWQVYHKVGMGNTKGLQLNLSTTEETSSSLWNNTSPTDTLFSIGASTRWEGNFIMYLWHDVPGMQKFGMYDANGSENGPFVYLGFRPAIIMLMCYSGSGENRYIYSDKAGEWQSSSANPNYSPSFLNDNAAANTSTTGYRVDFLSNGFRLRQANGPNTSSPASKYLYAAWAHQPMDNLYGAQSNAR